MQTLKTGSNEVSGDVRFETGDYGLTDLTATVNVPIGENIKTFVALSNRHVDDWDPTYYTDFSIADGANLESTVGGSTPDGDSIAINFNSGGKDGVSHRAKDDLKINATVVADLGPLNLRLSGVVDNQNREFNSLPIYNMFNNARLGEAERTLNMINMRANYFINPTMLVSAGLYTLNRKYEYYDCLLYTSPSPRDQRGSRMPSSA